MGLVLVNECNRLFTTVTQGERQASVCANALFGLDYPLKCAIAQEKADEIRESYWLSELPTCENTLFAFEPIRRIVPTTITRIATSMASIVGEKSPFHQLTLGYKGLGK